MMTLVSFDKKANDEKFKLAADRAIDFMKDNLKILLAAGHRYPLLWLAFVSGPTGGSTRYNMQPTPQGTTCTP